MGFDGGHAKKMASKGGPGKNYLRERGRKARQNFYLIQGEQSWFNFFLRPFFFGFLIFVFFFSFLFFFFFGGGGVISIILGYKGRGAPEKISDEERGHHILQELPFKSHQPPPTPKKMNGP